jgi:sulfur-oxidizing protein SoxX
LNQLSDEKPRTKGQDWAGAARSWATKIKIQMKTQLKIAASGILACLVAGCYAGPKSGKGFRLPEGNVENGKAAFLALHCNTCHKVDGVELPPQVATAPTNIVLGGEVSVIRTYGELVTSVINPSHGLAPGFKKEQIKDGKLSPMPEFNDTMTVRQMIDLVAFLQSRYRQIQTDDTY